MKNSRLLILSVIVGTIVVGVLFFYFRNTARTQFKLIVQPIGNNSIFAGEVSKSPADSNSYNHEKAVAVIDKAEEYIRVGNSYCKIDQYEEAARAYQEAYLIDKGGRAVSGLKLAMTYEKLSKYDEGIALLDQMIQNGELSEKGVQNANEIKSRLLTAKAAQRNES